MKDDKKGDRIWDKINALYYTYTLGTVAKAGTKLGVSHSSISKHISSLEEIMGEPLTYKDRKNLAFTKKGMQIIEVYQNLIFQHERAFDQLKRLPDLMQGHFTISFSLLLNPREFLDEIASFYEAHPSITFSFLTKDNPPILAAGESDIDIRPLLKREESHHYQYLTTYDMSLYASREYIEKKGLLERLSDLKHHDGLAISSDFLFPYAAPEWQALSEWNKLTIIDSYAHIFQAVEKGMGIGALPQTIARYSKTPLVPILQESFSQSIDLYYQTLQSTSENKVVQNLYTHLRNQPAGPLKGRAKR